MQTLRHPPALMLSVFERGLRSFNHLRLSMWGEGAEEDGDPTRTVDRRQWARH